MQRLFLLSALTACGSPSVAPTTPATSDDGLADETTLPWPGARWDRAEAIVFNQVEYGPGHALVAWSPDAGWHDNISRRTPVSAAHAQTAADLVAASGGGVEVSKCAFPRHAIVFFASDEPVASANVCFECGDLLAVPDPNPARDWNSATEAEMAAWANESEARVTRYEQELLPKWKALFADELALAIDWPPAP